MSERNKEKLLEKLYKTEISIRNFGYLLLCFLMMFFLFSAYMFKINNDQVYSLMFLSFCGFPVFGILVLRKRCLSIKNSITNQTYTYHYLDIKKYEKVSRGFNVYYELNGMHRAFTTDMYGATKIHVFKCNEEYLTIVETAEEAKTKHTK